MGCWLCGCGFAALVGMYINMYIHTCMSIFVGGGGRHAESQVRHKPDTRNMIPKDKVLD